MGGTHMGSTHLDSTRGQYTLGHMWVVHTWAHVGGTHLESTHMGSTHMGSTHGQYSHGLSHMCSANGRYTQGWYTWAVQVCAVHMGDTMHGRYVHMGSTHQVDEAAAAAAAARVAHGVGSLREHGRLERDAGRRSTARYQLVGSTHGWTVHVGGQYMLVGITRCGSSTRWLGSTCGGHYTLVGSPR